MQDRETAVAILQSIGGQENIESLTHCFTRLRFVLKDMSKADKEEVRKIPGVLSAVAAAGQFQVVCGAKVNKIYDEMISILGGEAGNQNRNSLKTETQSRGHLILQKIAEIFTPLVPAIAAAGLIKGLLTAAKLILAGKGMDITTTDTYVFLYAASQVIFYYFPVFLAMTCAKALRCNQVIAMMIGACLIFPQIDEIIQDTDTVTRFFGIPVGKSAWEIGDTVRIFSYTESVIPILLAVLVLYWLEKGLKKLIPELLQIILVPGLALLIMLPITFGLLGPIGIYIGNGVQFLYDSVMNISTVLGGTLLGGLWCVCVIFGAHRALVPIGLNDVAVNGSQNLLAFAGAANFAQGGAAFGVMLRTKNSQLKQIAASSSLTAAVVGITEPAIYGCNLRLKKPMIYAIICGAVGGGIMGLGNVYGDAFANNGILTIFTYAAFGMRRFIFYLTGIGVSFLGSAALTYFLGFEDFAQEAVIEEPKEQVKSDREVIEVLSPVKGRAYALREVKDEIFASEVLGKGAAIYPQSGEILAPDACTVTAVYPTFHAVGLMLAGDVELLIHIGIHTVELKGEGFTGYVKEGDRLNKGDRMVSFDLQEIENRGYDCTVLVLVTNTADFQEVNTISLSDIGYHTAVIEIVK